MGRPGDRCSTVKVRPAGLGLVGTHPSVKNPGQTICTTEGLLHAVPRRRMPSGHGDGIQGQRVQAAVFLLRAGGLVEVQHGVAYHPQPLGGRQQGSQASAQQRKQAQPSQHISSCANHPLGQDRGPRAGNSITRPLKPQASSGAGCRHVLTGLAAAGLLAACAQIYR